MRPKSHKKIAIWGTVASGKTTLSNQISVITRINNVLHTDDIFHPYYEKSTKNLKLIISEVQETLGHTTWIIDGNLDEKIPRIEIASRADLIIIFHYPIRFLLKRLLLREIREIINTRKPHEITTWKNFLHYKFQTIRLFFESIKLIKNYNQKFVYELFTMMENTNMGHKTFIVSSRKNLEYLLIHLT